MCGLQYLWYTGLVALQHVGSSGPGLKPVSPALADGFLTTAPPGKHYLHILNLDLSVFFLLICRNLLYILGYEYVSVIFCYLKNYPKSQRLKTKFWFAHNSVDEVFYNHLSGKSVPDPQLWCLGMEYLLPRWLLYSSI